MKVARRRTRAEAEARSGDTRSSSWRDRSVSHRRQSGVASCIVAESRVVSQEWYRGGRKECTMPRLPRRRRRAEGGRDISSCSTRPPWPERRVSRRPLRRVHAGSEEIQRASVSYRTLSDLARRARRTSALRSAPSVIKTSPTALPLASRMAPSRLPAKADGNGIRRQRALMRLTSGRQATHLPPLRRAGCQR